jgi:alkaline phosphatase D
LKLSLTLVFVQHFVPIIFTAGAIYVVAFLGSFFTTPAFDVISDEIDIVTKETTAQGDGGEEAELLDGAEDGPLEELDVKETVVLAEKDPARLRSLLLGLPSPTSLFWTMITFTINLALIAMSWDLVYRPYLLYDSQDLSFARVGYVSDVSANILVREPNANQLPIFVSYRNAESPLAAKAMGPFPDTSGGNRRRILDLINDTDYTAALTLSGLRPDTRYEYALSNNHSGYFRTAPRPGQPTRHNNGTFRFLHSSCILPHFPYNPISHPLEIPGFKKLAAWLPRLQAQFMLFLGDFIYIDVPHRFGSDIPTYRAEYRRVYASPDWPLVSDSLPWIHVWDDHEISNDWDRNTTSVFSASFDPYKHYHVSVNPEPMRRGDTWFSFTQGPVSFFMMDTRRYRSPENDDATDASKTMLGANQLADLLQWLKTAPSRGVKWKIVASSVPFTKNWHYGDKDLWGKYLVERQIILEAMWEVGATQGVGVVILSGDRHEFAATKFPPPANGTQWPKTAVVHEFSTSPLNMFYLPFKTYKQEDEEDICIE